MARGVRGDRELIAAMRRSAMIPASPTIDMDVAAGFEPMRAQAETNVRSLGLPGGVVVRKVKSRGPHFRVYWLSLTGSAKRMGHWFEFGTAPHSMAKGARRATGYLQDKLPFHHGTPARPWFTPAFESRKHTVMQILGQRFWDRIARAARAGVRR